MANQKLYDWSGSEYAVGTMTDGDETMAGMAWVSATSYVVVWTASGIQPEIRAQLFDASGTKIGGEFAVGADHGGSTNAVVAQLAGGGFVVAWEDVPIGPGGEPGLIRFQRFDANGAAVGAEGSVQTLNGHAHDPAIAGLAGGGFVVTWTDTVVSGLHRDLFGQRFDAAGTPAGAAFTVNTVTAQAQEASSITALPGGGFAVVWQDGSPQGERNGSGQIMADYGTDIAIQIFDAAGNKVGPQRVVDEMTPQVTFSGSLTGRVTATAPAVTALADGRLAVVWADFDGYIKTRILAADGTPLTPVLVNGELISPFAPPPAITALSDGGYAISWTEEARGPPDASASSVQVAIFDATGAPQGNAFVANQIVDGAQGTPAMLGLPGGGFAMAWQDASSASDGIDLRGRHFAPDAGAITDISFSAATISQTAIENIAVGRLGAEGALNGAFTYQILSDSSGAFRIEGDRLVVDDTLLLAAHEGDDVVLELRVTDTNGNSFQEILTVPISRPASGTLYVADDQFLAVDSDDDLFPTQSPDLLTLAGGRVLLTWNGAAVAQGFNIIGQLFEADGAPVAAAFTLNTLVNGSELEHDLAALPNGGFVATWTSSISDGATNIGVRAQIFDVDGAKVGSELVVNTTTTGTQQVPGVTALAGGGFFIAWSDFSGPSPVANNGEIKGQFSDGAGAKVGGEVVINTTTALRQTTPTVTELESGKILVAWTDNSATGGDTSVGAVRATLLNADGTPAVAEFLVNTTTLQHQHVASATALAGGGFVIVWRDTSENPVAETGQFRPADIRGQLYDADGQAVGGEFLINQDTYGAQAEPLVVPAPDGGFIVTWSTFSQFGGDDSSLSVMARSYAADGTPEGNEFLVNQIGEGQQSIPAVTFLASGDLVFAWWDLQNRHENGNVLREISARVMEAVADVANGTAGGEIIQGGDRIDIINGFGGDDTIGGGANDDLLRGGEGIDTLSGEAGDDLLDGGLGADAMAGGLGDDLFLVDDAGDTIGEGVGEGLDEAFTNLAAFSIAGFFNVENLTGGADDQTLTGNSGNNRIDGGAGADAMAGGGGNDLYIVDSLGDSVTELDGEGVDEVRTHLGSKAPPDRLVYVLPDFVENLTGTSAGAQGVRDNAQNNLITMGNGHDLVVADAGGVDTVNGGGGNDFVYHGDKLTAADITNGGAGVDTIGLLGDYGAGITFTASNLVGVERMALYTSLYLPGTGPNNYNIVMNDANVAAGTEFFVTAASLQSNETLIFNGAAETNGRFTVHGGGGADTIIGGTGSDFFIGNAGNDNLYGLGGSDVLTGGLGADQLRGGAGADNFRYLTTAQSTTGNVDRILDFQHVDRIDLSTIDANGNAGDGNSAFTFIGSNAFGNVAGELRAYQNGADWFVEGDTNGDGLADLVIQVTLPDASPLGIGDFIL